MEPPALDAASAARDLKDWLSSALEAHKNLLLEHSRLLGLLIEQREAPRRRDGSSSTRAETPRAVAFGSDVKCFPERRHDHTFTMPQVPLADGNGSVAKPHHPERHSPHSLTTPHSPLPDTNASTFVNLRCSSSRNSGRPPTLVRSISSFRNGGEDYGSILPTAPSSPISGFEVSGEQAYEQGVKAKLIDVSSPAAEPPLLDASDADFPPQHPCLVAEEPGMVSSPLSEVVSHEEEESDKSDRERQEWKEHLQKQVADELTKKKFSRRRPSMIDRHSSVSDLSADLVEPSRCAQLVGDLVARTLHLVEGSPFKWGSAGVIVCNVVLIGYTTSVGMANMLAVPPVPDPSSFEILHLFFTSIYILELVLRIIAYQREFIMGPDRSWNAFDAVLVLLAVSELVVRQADGGSVSLRIMRELRMFRVLRIIRVMRYFRDLRLMACSLLQSLAALSWALVLLVIIMYLFTIVFMQGGIMYLQNQYKEGALPDPEIKEGLAFRFGSVFDTMFTLLASIVNGVDWLDAVRPLEQTHMVYRWIYTFYVVFVVIGVLNVLTGIFVERACETSGLDKDLVIESQRKRDKTFLNEMKRIFEEADTDGSGAISWEEFKLYLQNDDVKAYLSTQQLDAFDARTLFDILNEGAGNANEMSIESFIVGCKRLKGMARSVDLVAVLKETRAANRKLKAVMRKLDGQHGPAHSESFRPRRTTSIYSFASASASDVEY